MRRIAKEGMVARAKAGRWFNLVAVLLAGAGASQPLGLCAAPESLPPRPEPVGAGAANPAAAQDTKGARAKLAAARTQLAQGNFDAAEALAREAAALNGKHLRNDDTPAKLLQDVAKAKTDPKALLQAARASLKRKEYDKAERYAKLADKHSGVFTFPVWSDSPSDVLKDVKAARVWASKQAPKGQTTAKAAQPRGGAANNNEKARTLRSGPPAATGKTGPKPAPKATKADAVALLRQGRQQLEQSKFDDALQTAQRIKTMTGVSWGLFEDSPDRLMQDVAKARAKHDREESGKVLAEARKLYEKKDFDGATRAAYRAEKLHGAYSIWELGDRPSKLLADVQLERARSRRTPLPPPVQPTALAENKQTAPAKGPEIVRTGATQVATTNPTNPTANGAPSAPSAQQVVAKLQAQQLLAQAQQLQTQGRLVDARAKLVEAQKLKAAFGPDEISPEIVDQQISHGVRRRVDELVKESHQMVSSPAATPPQMAERCRAAEEKLMQARQLAATFGQDVKPVELKIAYVRELAAGQGRAPSPVVQAGPGPNAGKGTELLDKARLELKRGDTNMARRLTYEACKPELGVKDEAVALLRSIDAEEFNQARLQANRAFEVVQAAYRRREYAYAGSLLSRIDARYLDAEHQARLRELAQTPGMQGSNPGVPAGTNPSGVVQAVDLRPAAPGGLPPLPGGPGPLPVLGGPTGRARVTDQGDDGLAKVKAMRAVVFDRLRVRGLDVQRDAQARSRNGEMDDALALLDEYLAELNGADLAPGQLTLLRRPVESRLKQIQLMKAQTALLTASAESRRGKNDLVKNEIKAQEAKRKNVDRLMKEFNELYRQGKYPEAESLASQAGELDPDNGVVTAAIHMARVARRRAEFTTLKGNKERMFLEGVNDAENTYRSAEALKKGGLDYDPERWAIAKNRKGIGPQQLKRYGEKEREIERKLTTPVNMSFSNAPLKSVLDDLRETNGINIVIDNIALQEDGVSLDSPVTIKLERVSLKAALNLVLQQVKLTYVIKDEVLQVTTDSHARGKLVTVTYQVTDLVIPIENHGPGAGSEAAPVVGQSIQPLASTTPSPVTGPYSMTSGTPTGTSTGPLPPAATPFASSSGSGGPSYTKRAASNTQEEMLIKLISSTVSPQSWEAMGGPGTIDYHPLTMALVINQTVEIQEQIEDLLRALRRLQDVEVAVEVRFITISEEFFERIGVNFNVNILTNNQKFEPSLTSGTFQQDPRFFNIFQPGRFLAGLTPAGTLTSDLNIPLTQQTFAQTIPQFGGYNGVPGYGGLTLGLAFLSDIQVFLFMEAVQGDTRTNVMQAPKLTMFNGQLATLSANDTQNFVTSVNVTTQNGQFLYQPNVQQIPFGTTLSITPVVSADRRFVRMNLNPTLRNLVGGTVQLFPIVTPIFPGFDGGNPTGQPIVFTQFIQQPVFASVTVNTTVSVPDGGTVLLGGLKRLSESRSEFGPPILSKIPYINRLFKNVGYGREAESLLIMVTPRIIVQEEEEERQTGFSAANVSERATGGR